jgi:DNA modification methylase
MKIISMPIKNVIPYDRNPRQNDRAVDAVARSIEEFGFRQPIVVTEDHVIIVGHTRWKAALKLGLKTVPVHVASGLTPEQIRAYRIADNKLGELADWDESLLAEELRELEAQSMDLALLGFSQEELDQLFGEDTQDGQTDPDDIPDPPDEATTRLGDLWILGPHRLLCGDAGSPKDVDRLVDGETIHLLNTDPPYNVRVEPHSQNAIAAGNSSFGTLQSKGNRRKGQPGKARHGPAKLRAKDRPLVNDFVSPEKFKRLLHDWFGNAARVLQPGASFYIWGGYANCGNYPPVLEECGLYFSQAIIWVKKHPVLTRKDFMGNHEWCFYGWREGAAHRFLGPANAVDVWSIKKVNPSGMIHLTEKPVALSVQALQYSSRPGENVLDLFGGSGSTLIAAEQTGRRALLMEMDPPYCDVIVERWERFTGQAASRVAADIDVLSVSLTGTTPQDAR